MKTQVKMLKVKIKSLAEEARIIRLEELRAMPHSKPRPREGKNGTAAIRPGLLVEKYADPELQRSLWLHRTVDLRQEQRSAMIAYAFLRGKLYQCRAEGGFRSELETGAGTRPEVRADPRQRGGVDTPGRMDRRPRSGLTAAAAGNTPAAALSPLTRHRRRTCVRYSPVNSKRWPPPARRTGRTTPRCWPCSTS
jgi:hypothetical protein